MYRCLIVVVLAACCLSETVDAQVPTLRAEGGAAPVGGSITSRVLVDNTNPTLLSWSYGLCIDQTALSLDSVASGATVSTINLGGLPQFESLDLMAGGLTHAVVICFTGCDTLPLGTAMELAIATYTVLPTASVSTDLCFCETLGSPVVETLFVESPSTQLAPLTQCGTVNVLTAPAPISGLLCSPVSTTCNCQVDMSWTNAELYDALEIRVDGVLLATLPGTDTTFSYMPTTPGVHDYCVTPLANTLSGVETCCLLNCDAPALVQPLPIAGLVCVTDPVTCTTTATWTNQTAYQLIRVLLDGVQVANLSGTATTVDVSLGTTGNHQICFEAFTTCLETTAQVCCDVLCAADFLRGDCNDNGNLNIVDCVHQLDLIFGISGLPASTCVDACDTNDDGALDIADASAGLNYLFNGAPLLPAPFGVCGFDPTDDDGVICDVFNSCP